VNIRFYGHDAGPGQVVVVYETDDTGAEVSAVELFHGIARDAAARAAHGWWIVTMASMPLRQTGTAGNVLFQSGGQFTTLAAVCVVYANGAASSG
jgi:hypothetical protein